MTNGWKETYRLIKVHVIGEDFNIRMKHTRLSDHFLQHIPNSSREDQQRNRRLMEIIKELLVSIPDKHIIDIISDVITHYNTNAC